MGSVRRNAMTTPKNFAVIYRTGGTENFKWVRVLDVFTREEAATKKAELERMGYPSLVHDAKKLESIGLPETP
jgi:hypothetical protein